MRCHSHLHDLADAANRVRRAAYYLDAALGRILDRYCHTRGDDKSEVVREALHRYLAEQGERRELSSSR